MKTALGVLAVAAFLLVLDWRLMALEQTRPDLYAAWLTTVAAGLPLWAWAVRKYRRGDFG